MAETDAFAYRDKILADLDAWTHTVISASDVSFVGRKRKKLVTHGILAYVPDSARISGFLRIGDNILPGEAKNVRVVWEEEEDVQPE